MAGVKEETWTKNLLYVYFLSIVVVVVLVVDDDDNDDVAIDTPS